MVDIAVDQALGHDEAALGSHLGEIRAAAQRPITLGSLDKTGIFGRLFRSPKREVKRLTERFLDARQRVDTVALHLQDYLHQVDHGLVVLERMFEANAQKAKELTRYAEAGKLALSRHRRRGGTEDDASNVDGLAAQRDSDRDAAIDQLERRVSDLDRSRVVTLGMLGTIRQTQAIGQALVEQIQKTIDHAIPAWKEAMIIRLQQMQQRHGLAALASLDDIARPNGQGARDTGPDPHQQLMAALDKIEQLEKDAGAVEINMSVDPSARKGE